MGSYTNAGKANMLNSLGVTHAALFDGDPASGGTECAGDDYERQPVTFGAPSAGVMAASGSLAFSVPEGFTIRWVGWYDADTAGTLLAKDEVDELEVTEAGVYTVPAETFSII